MLGAVLIAATYSIFLHFPGFVEPDNKGFEGAVSYGKQLPKRPNVSYAPSSNTSFGKASLIEGSSSAFELSQLTDSEYLVAVSPIATDPSQLFSVLGFSPNEITFAKTEILKFSKRMARLFMANVSEDYLLHDPKKGVYAYRCKPFPDGQRELHRFRSSLKQRLGEEKTGMVFKSVIHPESFSSFGTVDSTIRFSEPDGKGNRKWLYEAFNVETGAGEGSSHSDYTHMSMHWTGPLYYFLPTHNGD